MDHSRILRDRVRSLEKEGVTDEERDQMQWQIASHRNFLFLHIGFISGVLTVLSLRKRPGRLFAVCIGSTVACDAVTTVVYRGIQRDPSWTPLDNHMSYFHLPPNDTAFQERRKARKWLTWGNKVASFSSAFAMTTALGWALYMPSRQIPTHVWDRVRKAYPVPPWRS